MKASCSMLVVASVALTLSGCSKADKTPAATEAAPALAEAPKANGGSPLPPEALAFINILSHEELGQVRLGCIEPLRTAKAYTKNFDAETQADLDSIDYLSLTDLLSKPPLNSLTVAEARAIMNASPKFAPNETPKAEDVVGLKQCILIAKHHASEQTPQA